MHHCLGKLTYNKYLLLHMSYQLSKLVCGTIHSCPDPTPTAALSPSISKWCEPLRVRDLLWALVTSNPLVQNTLSYELWMSIHLYLLRSCANISTGENGRIKLIKCPPNLNCLFFPFSLLFNLTLAYYHLAVCQWDRQSLFHSSSH